MVCCVIHGKRQPPQNHDNDNDDDASETTFVQTPNHDNNKNEKNQRRRRRRIRNAVGQFIVVKSLQSKLDSGRKSQEKKSECLRALERSRLDKFASVATDIDMDSIEERDPIDSCSSTREIEQLRSEVGAQKVSNKKARFELGGKIEDAHREIISLREKITELNKMNSTLKLKIELKEKSVAERDYSITVLRYSQNEIQQNCQELKRTLEESTQRLASYQERMHGLEKTNSSLNADFEAASRKLEESRKRVKSFEREGFKNAELLDTIKNERGETRRYDPNWKLQLKKQTLKLHPWRNR